MTSQDFKAALYAGVPKQTMRNQSKHSRSPEESQGDIRRFEANPRLALLVVVALVDHDGATS
jgi:hypothetical protein